MLQAARDRGLRHCVPLREANIEGLVGVLAQALESSNDDYATTLRSTAELLGNAVAKMPHVVRLHDVLQPVNLWDKYMELVDSSRDAFQCAQLDILVEVVEKHMNSAWNQDAIVLYVALTSPGQITWANAEAHAETYEYAVATVRDVVDEIYNSREEEVGCI